MKKSKKILIIVIGVIFGLLLLIGGYICWAIFGGYDGDISLMLETRSARYKAQRTAREYVLEKYGEKAEILSAKAHFGGGGWFGPSLYLDAVEVSLPGYRVLVKDNTGCDDRQYEEICAAVRERYFDDIELGSSNTGGVSVLFSELTGIDEDSYHCTSVYFDGDIESFLYSSGAGLAAEYIYEGYPEKSGDYRKLLEDKLSELKYYFNDEDLNVMIHIKDPGLDLPEMPYARSVDGDHKIRRVPMYDDFMELIACAYIDHYDSAVVQTEFWQLDEYTAVSDNSDPIRSDAEITFEQVDLSDNTTVCRGRYKYDYHRDENILTIRDTGWRISLAGRGAYNVFLRMDREHYNITDAAIPLIVADLRLRESPLNEWETRRCYLTVGYGNYHDVDTNPDDWYYLDDKYLYLMISYVQSDLNNDWILTFSDSPLPE